MMPRSRIELASSSSSSSEKVLRGFFGFGPDVLDRHFALRLARRAARVAAAIVGRRFDADIADQRGKATTET